MNFLFSFQSKHCKHKLLPGQLEDIVCHIKANMKEGEKEEDVDVNVEIPPNILKSVLDNSRKRKADSSNDYRHCKVHVSAHGRCCDTAETIHGEDPRDVEGDRKAKPEEYCKWA